MLKLTKLTKCYFRSFLEQIKEASARYLYEKREAQDALNLLKLYHASTISQSKV